MTKYIFVVYTIAVLKKKYTALKSLLSNNEYSSDRDRKEILSNKQVGSFRDIQGSFAGKDRNYVVRLLLSNDAFVLSECNLKNRVLNVCVGKYEFKAPLNARIGFTAETLNGEAFVVSFDCPVSFFRNGVTLSFRDTPFDYPDCHCKKFKCFRILEWDAIFANVTIKRIFIPRHFVRFAKAKPSTDFGAASQIIIRKSIAQTEEKGCRLRTFECEDKGVYQNVNDRSPNHEKRTQDAPLSSVWSC